MPTKIKKVITVPKRGFLRASSILGTFLKDESIAGKLIIVFALIAMVLVNTPLRETYDSFWSTYVNIGVGDFFISQDLRHWVNEGLMAVFFLVVGLEIKRELVHGELKDKKKALLPAAAALGGMVVPALIYFAFNMSGATVQGWGIPIATDIAFAVAVLSLLGKRVPLNLKIFLLSLAIVDDIGAIFIIALFYAEIINYLFLAISIATVVGLFLLRKKMIGHLWIFVLIGLALWITTHLSGIHASIVGAALGLLAPLTAPVGRVTISKRLETFFLPISTFVALPVFALANAGLVLSASTFAHPDAQPMMMGIILGLVVGKFIGISGVAWLMVRSGRAALPDGVNWFQIIGVSFIAGIGFTVSIFITELAFTDPDLATIAKMSVFIASLLAAALGTIILLIAARNKQHSKSKTV